jgi:uncharacterized protein YebE (UPF0316 family)
MKRGPVIRRVDRMESFMIMMLVLFEVALWQWRVAITIRGNLLGGVLLGLVGAVVQVTAISWVVRDMGDVTKVAGYAVGVAIGVGVGGLIDRHLSTWDASVRVFAPAGTALDSALRDRGWPVTATSARGHEGPVEMLYIAVDQRRTAELERVLRSLAPNASWTIERISSSRGLLAVSSS